MGQKPNLEDYNTVPERMAEFFAKYSEGSFQADCSFTEINGRWVAVVKAYAYRHPEDPRPGTGWAYEYIPGNTPYTKDSELQNAETSAWGRAVMAVGAADSRKGITSREEVRNRTAENVTSFPDNAEGRHALRVLCEQTNWAPEDAANLFRDRFKKAPMTAPNDELLSFVNMVKTGVIQMDPQPA